MKAGNVKPKRAAAKKTPPLGKLGFEPAKNFEIAMAVNMAGMCQGLSVRELHKLAESCEMQAAIARGHALLRCLIPYGPYWRN